MTVSVESNSEDVDWQSVWEMERLIRSVASLLLAASSALMDEVEPVSTKLVCFFSLFVMEGLGLAATLCEGILETLLLLTLLVMPLTCRLRASTLLDVPGLPALADAGGHDCSILPRGGLLCWVLLEGLGETAARCSLLLALLGGLDEEFRGTKLPLPREGL